jgi:hypothetical protein
MKNDILLSTFGTIMDIACDLDKQWLENLDLLEKIANSNEEKDQDNKQLFMNNLRDIGYQHLIISGYVIPMYQSSVERLYTCSEMNNFLFQGLNPEGKDHVDNLLKELQSKHLENVANFNKSQTENEG